MTEDASHHVSISKVVISQDEIDVVVDVLRSGNLREGPQCQAFEEEFAQTVGCKYALTSSSGTAALQMAYQALFQPGDEVLVPSFTFFATASMLLAIGAIPVFCDIDLATLTLDVDDAAQRITPRTRGIVPVHLFGNPVDVPAVQKLARRHDLIIVWDAAQAHGTRYDGRDVGSYNDAVCYSFYPSKNMTTGEGGMVCTSDEYLAARLKLIRSHGESSKYVHVTLGYNFRMTDVQAAIGRGQLHHLPSWIMRRRQNAAYLRNRFVECPLLRVQQEQQGGTHSYHQFTVVLDERVNRDALVCRLHEAGIESVVYYPTPVHRQPMFDNDTPLPASEAACPRVLSLPVHPHLTPDDLACVADHVLAALPDIV